MIPAALLALVLSGPIDHLHDGDTFHIEGQRVRLAGIDAPESGQSCTAANTSTYDCGTVAKLAIERIIANRPLTCSYTERDRYQRPLVTCQAAGDLLSLNEQMVMRGWALAYDFGKDISPYHPDQDLAQRQRLGLWAGTFERPADWRREHRIPSRN